jgi:hypothetical protein
MIVRQLRQLTRCSPQPQSCVNLIIPLGTEVFSQGDPSGRSAAWLARLVRDQEVDGSNPFAPTTYLSVQSEEILYRTFRRHTLHLWAKRVV